MSKTIAILNQKGGVGKTTTAINLGSYLSKAGHNVLLVDFDPQGNATSGLGIDKKGLDNTSYQILMDGLNAESAIKETNLTGLYIIPANENLAAAETELGNHQQRELLLGQALQSLNYDYILIDCPPSLGLLTINALAAANYLLIPVQAEYYAMEGLGQLMEVFKRVKQALNPNLEILGLVLTMYDKRTALADNVLAELKKHFSTQIFTTIIPRNVRLAEAPSFGMPISEHDKWSKGARAYKNLAREISKRLEADK